MKKIVLQFMQQESNHVVQFIKYVLAGGVATVVDVAIFYAMSIWVLPALDQQDIVAKLFELQVPEMTNGIRSFRFACNSLVSFAIANFVCYLVNIAWVFKRGRHHWLLELGLFYLVSGISIAVGVGLGTIIIGVFGVSTTYSFIAKAVSSLLINYVCRKFLIFHG